MSKYLIVLLFLSTLVAKDIATVKLLQGDVRASLEGKTQALSVGDALSGTMVVQTTSGSSTTIVFKDNSVLVLGENSIVNLKKYIFEPTKKSYNFELFLQKGSAVFESGDIGKLSPESFVFETPQGTVAIRGTKFVVKVE